MSQIIFVSEKKEESVLINFQFLLEFEMEGMYVASEDQIQVLQIDTEGPPVK